MSDSNSALQRQPGADRFVEIYRALNSVEAHALRNYLASRGKAAFIEGEPLTMVQGGIPFDATAPRVLVEASDSSAARELLADWQSRRKQRKADYRYPTLRYGLPLVLGNLAVLAGALAFARGDAEAVNVMTSVLFCLLLGNWTALVYFRWRRRNEYSDA